MATAERWVGVNEVAAHLGVAKDSVYRWIEERGLPAHRVGRLFRFKLSEIDTWVRQGKEVVKASHPIKKRLSSRSTSKAPSGKKEGNE
ncbi:helix-turn-helix domain-containing protein [Syntrophorhabdus aromaticivorans]|uniref:helix-turn-helix domain-containing protein n=1 Tax=Syntrophorhabdus aromaticivorans TaxID=328301 RepID=UPI0005648E38|nr:helix-turn-helix domain-containing protein [Syntrophorhabdus aromaticivorans]